MAATLGPLVLHNRAVDSTKGLFKEPFIDPMDLCLSSCLIEENTLFIGGIGSISNIWPLTAANDSFDLIKNCITIKDLDKPNSTEASKNKIKTNADKDKVQGNSFC